MFNWLKWNRLTKDEKRVDELLAKDGMPEYWRKLMLKHARRHPDFCAATGYKHIKDNDEEPIQMRSPARTGDGHSHGKYKCQACGRLFWRRIEDNVKEEVDLDTLRATVREREREEELKQQAAIPESDIVGHCQACCAPLTKENVRKHDRSGLSICDKCN